MIWMQQLNPMTGAKCHVCGAPMSRTTIYFRAVVEPDSPDAEGYDCCPACRHALPSEPLPKETFPQK